MWVSLYKFIYESEELQTQKLRQQRGQIGTASSSRCRKQEASESMDIC